MFSVVVAFSQSAMFIFEAINFLPGALWNEKLPPVIEARFLESIYGAAVWDVRH